LSRHDIETISLLFVAVGNSGSGTGAAAGVNAAAAEQTTGTNSQKDCQRFIERRPFCLGETVLPCKQSSDNPFCDLQL
jgi:hypothetical protein